MSDTSPLKYMRSRRIKGGRPGPHLLITGGVHGDEFESMVAIRALMSELAPLHGSQELAGTLTCIPVANELAFARCARTAEDGLDLARVCPGRPDGSITERVAHELSSMVHQSDYYIDLHTGGTIFQVHPLAGYMLHTDSNVLDAQRAMARAFNLPVIWGTHPGLDGRSISVARDANVPAIYVEYLGGGMCAPEGVAAYVDGCRNVMSHIGMLHRPKPTSALKHIVEDARPGAGHMQAQNPAPHSGYFASAVTLGGRVEAGEPLGTVVDPLGQLAAPVPSRESGVVITLRTYPSVKQGDALAVVLEVDSPHVTHATE